MAWKLLLILAVLGALPSLRGEVSLAQDSSSCDPHQGSCPTPSIRVDSCDQLCSNGKTVCCTDTASPKCCPQGYVCEPSTKVCHLPCDSVVCKPGQTCIYGDCKCVDRDCQAKCGVCSGDDCVIACGLDSTTPTNGTDCHGATGRCECTDAECAYYCSLGKSPVACCSDPLTCTCCPTDQFCFTGRRSLSTRPLWREDSGSVAGLEKTTYCKPKDPCAGVSCDKGETCSQGNCLCDHTVCGQGPDLLCKVCADQSGYDRCVPKTCQSPTSSCDPATGSCKCDPKLCLGANCGACDGSGTCVAGNNCPPTQTCNPDGKTCECTPDFCQNYCAKWFSNGSPHCKENQCICLKDDCQSRADLYRNGTVEKGTRVAVVI